MNGQMAPACWPAARIATLAASFIAGAIQFWMMPPLTALLLERRGAGAAAIGAMGAVPWVALVLAAPAVARAIARFGMRRVYRAGVLVTGVSLAGFMAGEALALWFTANALLGLGLGMRWIAADAFVAGAVPAGRRGLVLGAYETLAAGSIGLGPFLLTLTGTESLLPHGVAALLLAVQFALAGALPDVRRERTHEPWWRAAARVARRDPAILAAALLCGLLEGIATTALPVHGVRAGLDPGAATLLVATLGAGAIALQVPLGWLADRARPATVYALAGAVVVAGAVLLPAALASPRAGAVMLAAWGGTVAALYLFALIGAGRAFAGEALTEAVAGVAVTYTLGGAFGPPLGGLGLALDAAWGVPGVLAAVGAAGSVVVLVLLPRPAGVQTT